MLLDSGASGKKVAGNLINNIKTYVTDEIKWRTQYSSFNTNTVLEKRFYCPGFSMM